MIQLILDRVLQNANITRYELSKRTGIQFQILDNYYKNKVVRYDSYILDRICKAIGCTPGDLIEFQKDDSVE